MGILRVLSYALSSALHVLIPELYDMFFRLSSATYFNREEIQGFSRNIYVIVSACMLFALGIRLLGAIVNPDSFNDNKKGAKRTFINCIIAVLLIAVVPIGFDKAYEAQNSLLEDNMIASLFLGTETNDDGSIGRILALETFGAFCHPNEGYVSIETNDDWEILKDDFNSQFLDNFGDHIRDENNGDYEIEYHILLSPAFGFYMVYQMILMCLDAATRAVRLALLELMAPLVICAFIFSGTELLQRWFKDVLSTYITIFARVVGIVFTVFGISKIDSMFDESSFSGLGIIGKGFLTAAIMIGLLTVVKQLPAIINNIFGTNIQDQGGIRGRLGNMAGIGAMAQNAWDNLRQHPIRSTARVISAPVSALGGAVAHTVAAASRSARHTADLIRNGHGIRAVGSVFTGIAATAVRSAPGLLGASVRAGRAGWQNGNLQGIGQAGTRYEQTHPEGSTLLGRARDTVSAALGGTSSHQDDESRIQDIRYRFKGRNLTEDEFKNASESYNTHTQALNNAREAAEKIVTHSGSNRPFNIHFNDADGNVTYVNGHNYDEVYKRLESLRAQAPQQRDGETQAQFMAREQAHNTLVSNFEAALNAERDLQRDNLIMYAFNHGGNGIANARESNALFEIQNSLFDFNDALDRERFTDRDNHNITAINGANIASFNAAREGMNGNTGVISHARQDRENRVNEVRNSEAYRRHVANENAVNARNNNGGGNNGGH